jgi:hypothetical protein
VAPPSGQARKDVLFKLIQIEPDHLSNLVQATGWGEEQTRMALLQLTVDGLVTHHNRSGRQFFRAISDPTTTSGEHAK